MTCNSIPRKEQKYTHSRRVMGCSFQLSSSSSRNDLFMILFFSSKGIKFSIIRCLHATTKMRNIPAHISPNTQSSHLWKEKGIRSMMVLLWCMPSSVFVAANFQSSVRCFLPLYQNVNRYSSHFKLCKVCRVARSGKFQV